MKNINTTDKELSINTDNNNDPDGFDWDDLTDVRLNRINKGEA